MVISGGPPDGRAILEGGGITVDFEEACFDDILIGGAPFE